jgi:GTP cyclohydrolase II
MIEPIPAPIDSHPAASHEWGPCPQADIVAVAALPTRFGNFRVVAFTGDPQGKEHLALVRGDVGGASCVPVRMHSECLTGDVLGSLRCDCRDQLITSLQILGGLPRGVLLYLRQEGRGIGLTNKIRAYALQDQGHDTIEANLLLGFRSDQRDYRMAAQMLRSLGIQSVHLMTNNPAKVIGLREHSMEVVGRIPILVRPNRHNAMYLDTKQKRAGHWLSPTTQAPGCLPPLAPPGSPHVPRSAPDPSGPCRSRKRPCPNSP